MPPRWVRIQFPPEFRNGRALAEHCAWRVKEDGADFLICTNEAYYRTPPRLLVATRLANYENADDATVYERFRRWSPQDRYDLGTPPHEVMEEIAEHQRAATPERVAYALQLAILMVPDAGVPDLVHNGFKNAILPNYPNASVWTVEVDPILHRRVAALRALFAADAVPEVFERGPERYEGFAAGRGLSSNVLLGFEPYLHPALLAPSPWLLGLTAARLGGAIVFLFGDPVLGVRNVPATELLQLYRPRFGTKRVPPPNVPSITAAQVEAFFAWWVQRINVLFARTLDPAEYANDQGVHEPRRQFAIVLSLERLFVCLHMLLALGMRDDFVRFTLLFEILDLLEGVRTGSVEQLVTRSAVEKRVARLQDELPPDVAAVALPKCQGALAALADVATGFYLTERISDAGIQVRTKDGASETLSIDRATAGYLRVLRNAAHSYMRHADDPRDLSLLAAHNGILHPGLPDLAFLHLLHLIHDPTTVRA